MLEGFFVVVEGDNLQVRCKYDDVIPTGNTSLYFYNGVGIEIKKVSVSKHNTR